MKRAFIKTILLLFSGASFLFSCDSTKEEINLLEPTIEIDQNSFTFDINGGKVFLKISTTGQWKVKNSPDWLIMTPTSGDASTQTTIAVVENRKMEGRIVDLVITTGSHSQTLHVAQEGLKDISPKLQLPIFAFNSILPTFSKEGYIIKTMKSFINADLKNKIFLGNLLCHKASSNRAFSTFTDYQFNTVDMFSNTSIKGKYLIKSYTPSLNEQQAFAQMILAERPTQMQSFTADNGIVEFYTYQQLHHLGVINLGAALDEVLSGVSFRQQEMKKKYGVIFSFKEVLFNLQLDFPITLLKEKLKDADKTKGISYINQISYGKIGLLIAESNIHFKKIKATINKVIVNDKLSQEELNLIAETDISHVYFIDHKIQIRKGHLEAIESYKEAIKNIYTDIYPIEFELTDLENFSTREMEFPS